MDLSNFGINIKKKKLPQINDPKLEINLEEIQKNFIDKKDSSYFLPWFIKYQINSFEELPQNEQTNNIINYIKTYKPSKNSKALLLAGPPGCGKTTTITLLAKYFNYELFEINASDYRNKKSIYDSLKNVIKSESLLRKKKIILIDEIDGVAGKEDRGGISEIVKFIKLSKFPIIATANEIESEKIKPIKKVSIIINFEKHQKDTLLNIGKKILKKEKIDFDKKNLEEFIEKRASFDIRGFINDLQASIINSKFVPDNKNIEIRNYKQKINSILNKIYYSYPQDSLENNYFSDIKLDDLFLYIEENTPKAYDKIGTFYAFNEISKADVYNGRITKWQYYRYLVYINFYLTYGVSASKNKVKKINFEKNKRILKKWIYSNKMSSFSQRTKIQKNKGEEEKFIEKLAKLYKTSISNTYKTQLYYFAKIYQNNAQFQKKMDEKLNIDKNTKEKLLNLK